MFKVLKNGKTPTRGSKYSACVDLYASHDVVIGAGETAVVGLGVCIDLENSNVYKTSDYVWAKKKNPSKETLEIIKQQVIRDFMRENYLQLMLRSSLGKKGLILPNGVGVIDLDYKDEIKMIIHKPLDGGEDFDTTGSNISFNDIGHSFKIKKGDRIAQITLLEHKSFLFGIESNDVRDGGLGSTGNIK